MKINRIMFPTDFSESSDAALSYASALAAEAGALLYIVHVGSDSSAYLAGYGGFGALPNFPDQVAREHRALLNKVEPTAANVDYRHQHLDGDPAQEILSFAEREHIDLIVIGSHGRTGVSRLLLGSIAEAVVRRAKCPVLAVKQPMADFSEADNDQRTEHLEHQKLARNPR